MTPDAPTRPEQAIWFQGPRPWVDQINDPTGWAMPGLWQWILANPQPCTPIPNRGALGLWTVPDELVDADRTAAPDPA